MKNTKQTAKHEDSYVMVPIEKQNLALVASAPLMFEALEAVLNMGDDYEAEKLVRKAIAKAKGE